MVDNYRWLEDDLSEETAQWVETQNKLTFGELEKIPFRAALQSRLEKLWNYEKIVPRTKNVNTPTFQKMKGYKTNMLFTAIKKTKQLLKFSWTPILFQPMALLHLRD